MTKAGTTVRSNQNVAAAKNQLKLKRLFTKSGTHPFEEINWLKRDAVVGHGDKIVFEQREVEFPDFWSAHAVNIAASKYFRGKLGTPQREYSAKQMVSRVATAIRAWGEKFGYFDSATQAQLFEDELTHLLIYQKGAFNSPVWFNVGTCEKPQCSACFILSVEDDMHSILEWIETEGMIFKHGSGAGVNLSRLRSKKESLSAGGKASGPVSFMRGADSVAGMIKSGGTTRRAAKMVILDIDHPDIMDFIRCKADEEKKIQALSAAGYDMSDLNNEAWYSIQFQNANNSVRITDEFMQAVERDDVWQTKSLTTGEVAETYHARDLLNEIAQAAWECGDPGIQFDTIINDWHTCPASGRINGSNPCSEYMHLDNSACNLASLNLMKFLAADGTFMVEEFKHAVDVFILAQEILVGASSYPTEKIARNAINFRELGLGYANLGALLMAKSLPYDSDAGRAVAGAISALMCGEAYRYSAEIARKIGSFDGYRINREPMLRVISKHKEASQRLSTSLVDDAALTTEAREVWAEALRWGEKYGFRNSQVTVIAPTGTIALMMDCNTTGIEPDFSLIKMKQLVGGGWMKIVNDGVGAALRKLHYSREQAEAVVDWIAERGTIEGAPGLKAEHLPIFDCAVRPAGGTRSISWQGHVKMVGAVQPFVSGAISKTFNMSNEATKEDIIEAYLMTWRLGIKAFAVYRDGSKATQPLQTAGQQKKPQSVGMQATVSRRNLPDTRASETHKFSIVGHEGFLTYGMFEDGTLAEVFIRMSKQGSTLAGLLDAFAISVSMALQYGVPLKSLASKFIHSRFEPAGFTENPNIQIATSIVDYIFRYLSLRFLSTEELSEFGMTPLLTAPKNAAGNETVAAVAEKVRLEVEARVTESIKIESTATTLKKGYAFAGTVCRKCGGMMVRSGTCYTCLQCGEASGGC